MTWIVLSIIFLVALWCQTGVWRRWIRNRQPLRTPYLALTAGLWLLLVLCIALNAIFDLGNTFMKINGILLLVFGTLVTVEATFLIFDLLQRLTRCPRRVTAALSTAVSLVAVAVVVGGTFVGRTRLRTEHIEVASERLPDSFDGFRIVLFSDVHTGMMFSRNRMLADIVETINSLQPDLVVNCGDIVNYDYTELDAEVLSILSAIRSTHGVAAVLGNHDLAISHSKDLGISPEEHAERVAELERSIGWNLLSDSTIYITRGSDTISVTGVNYPKEIYRHSHRRLHQPQDLGETYGTLSRDLFNITLSHAPQLWDAIKAAGYGDLTLSGHVHSMQTKLRLGTWRWSPAALLYPQWSGRYDDCGRTLYINDGIGSIFVPMRIGARPEITLIELKTK